MPSTGATITVTMPNIAQSDNVAASRANATAHSMTEALSTVFAVPFLSDTTTHPISGQIIRTIQANFTSIFMAAYPTDAQRLARLTGDLATQLSLIVPCQILSETVFLF